MNNFFNKLLFLSVFALSVRNSFVEGTLESNSRAPNTNIDEAINTELQRFADTGNVHVARKAFESDGPRAEGTPRYPLSKTRARKNRFAAKKYNARLRRYIRNNAKKFQQENPMTETTAEQQENEQSASTANSTSGAQSDFGDNLGVNVENVGSVLDLATEYEAQQPINQGKRIRKDVVNIVRPGAPLPSIPESSDTPPAKPSRGNFVVVPPPRRRNSPPKPPRNSNPHPVPSPRTVFTSNSSEDEMPEYSTVLPSSQRNRNRPPMTVTAEDPIYQTLDEITSDPAPEPPARPPRARPLSLSELEMDDEPDNKNISLKEYLSAKRRGIGRTFQRYVGNNVNSIKTKSVNAVKAIKTAPRKALHRTKDVVANAARSTKDGVKKAATKVVNVAKYPVVKAKRFYKSFRTYPE